MSRTSVCVSNLGQLGKAMTMYLGDNEDTFPVCNFNDGVGGFPPITHLDDGSFFVEFRGGQFAHQRFRGYDVVLANGRRERRAAGSPDATHRIVVTSSGARRVTELSYPAAHMLTYLEVEQQLYEADPLQG